MIEAVPTALAPQDLLFGLQATKNVRRFAGEWDLTLPAGGGGSPTVRVLRSFVDGFGAWTTFTTLSALGPDGQRAWDGHSVADRWLAGLPEPVYGFEASLDLDLSWTDGAGRSDVGRFPDAADLLFDREAATATLTIWPNVFSDEIHLYRPEGKDRFDRRLVPFAPAAAVNRAQLRTSLRRWAERSGGEITAWGSDLLDGAEQWGFDADCALR
jgi:hypothetical protein